MALQVKCVFCGNQVDRDKAISYAPRKYVCSDKCYKDYDAKVKYKPQPTKPKRKVHDERLGETNKNKQGCLMKIIEYNTYSDIVIEFQDENKQTKRTRYEKFINGSVSNDYLPQCTFINRVGDKSINREGYLCSVVKHVDIKNNLVLIEFSDLYNTRIICNYHNFKNGKIHNPNNHLGEKSKTTEGYIIKIIKIVNSRNVIVEFEDEHKYTLSCQYDTFLKGNIKNPYHKSIIGIGYIGETLTTIGKSKSKNSYITWKHMIERCYTKRDDNKDRTYKDVFVCEEWLCYANFEKWYNENYYDCDGEIMNLDKDILIKGNKLYSPDACIFAPKKINGLFVRTGIERYVEENILNDGKKRYRVHLLSKKTGSKYFDTKIEALEYRRVNKELYIKEVADKYKDKIPKKLYDAMYSYVVELND